MKRGAVDFACPIAARTVKIALRHGGGLGEPDRVYVRCDQRDCQHVDRNEPPCPLRVEMFSDDNDRRVARYLEAHAGRLVCYGCVTKALGIDHDQARRASWRLKNTRGFAIRPARCGECRSRRVAIGFAVDRSVAARDAAPLAGAPGGTAAGAPDDPGHPLAPPATGPATHAPGPVEAYLRGLPGYWLCAHCVARETRIDAEDVRAIVYALDRRQGFRLGTTQCVSCLLIKRTVRFDEAAGADDASARVLRTLFQSGGEAVCAACIAFATDAPLADVKRVLGYLEPLPEFVRRVEACSVCGRWQPVIVAEGIGIGPQRLGELHDMIEGVVWHRGYRVELLSFRTAEGWRPFALVKTASRALVPDAPAMLLSILKTKADADEAAAAHARQWIDKRFGFAS